MTRARRSRRRPGRAGVEPVVRFLLRLPAAIHRQLTARARVQQLSLNEYCVRVLAASHDRALATPAVLDVRSRAAALVGEHLLGLIAHGSSTRGEARTTSDVDVLIVADRPMALTRTLHRRWDADPIAWEGRPIDVHFIHLPVDADRAGAVWCEAAVDGVLLFDADGRVQQTLLQIRRAIAEGRLVRKHAHGQPYWTGAA
jgi:predicted nucleotidyltransferase